jgi:serine/threonine protein kinase
MSAARRRFRIIKEIAEGGFGKVYLAEQISSDGFSRIVAVKLLHAKWSSHDEVVQRTRDEARLLGLIRHQHIVKVEDLTSIDGKCAIVMEYLEGVDLKWMMQFLKDRNDVFPRAALFEIILAVASALDAAYNSTPLQGGDPLRVIHRDIKPSNIFVTVAGGVKVLDFGTARANFAEREAKTQALAFGSQGYMAPERMLGEEDTPAADIFSLGITLYELLTLESFGRIPPRPNKFQKKIEERVATVKLEGEPEWIEQVRDTLSLMLSYDPKDRPTAAQLVEIMELLAQEAKDVGLRRYCRTTVAEAKAALPDPEQVDPLSGAIVDEDASAGTGAQNRNTMQPVEDDANGAAAVAPGNTGPRPRSAPPSTTDTSGPQLGTATSGSSAFTGTSIPQPKPVPALQADRQVATTGDQGSSATSIAVLAGGGLSVVLLVVGAVAAILVVGLVIWLATAGDGTTVATPVPDPVPEQPVPTEPAPPPPTGIVGGKVTNPGKGPAPTSAKTTLTFSDPAGGEVRIKGPAGFEAEWDGKAPFEVGPLNAGAYKANVKFGTQNFRLKSFVVDDTKKTCAFSFDAARGEWTGRCQ